MRTTFDIGNEAEGIVLSHYIKAGLRVCIPFGTGGPYDLAVDIGKRIVKVQVKTAIYENGCIRCKTRRRNASYPRTMRRYEESEVDYFAIYCPQLDELFGIPFRDAKVTASLRIEPTGNKQERGVRWAKDYSWEKHIAELKADFQKRNLNTQPAGYESVALTS
jgi:hypothetical protein